MVFVAMGAFMGAAAQAVRANNRKRSAITIPAEDGINDAEIRRIGAESDQKRAEATLGRPETREERVERECERFGYSMG